MHIAAFPTSTSPLKIWLVPCFVSRYELNAIKSRRSTIGPSVDIFESVHYVTARVIVVVKIVLEMLKGVKQSVAVVKQELGVGAAP